MITALIVMTGLMAGIYFTFSVFVMKSLALLPPVEGANAMNKINDVIVKTAFLPLFFISTLAHLVLFVWALAEREHMVSLLYGTAAFIYIVGMFVITLVGNVPLNNTLKESARDESLMIATWKDYLDRWPMLNHIRTLSCIASLLLLAMSVSISASGNTMY